MEEENKYTLDAIHSPTRTELVELELRRFFKQNNLKPGDPIPKETELAKLLNVSRTVIREALSHFRMLGLIESRKKRGMVLTSPDILDGLESVLYPSFLDKRTLIDVFEMRIVLELGLGNFLFARKTQKDITDLEIILDGHKGKSNGLYRLEEEVQFHGKLYDITGNETLHRFQKLLLPIFGFVIENEIALKNPPKKSTVSHKDLIEILKKGNASTFTLAMEEHLRPHLEALVFYKERVQARDR
jgi:GntR family transcriptional repressor for pyruvate dehydrogenase complex